MIINDNFAYFFIKTYVVGGEAILMSTHNIGFYEDLTKIIFELSSNIIKYAPYFFCWMKCIMPAVIIKGYNVGWIYWSIFPNFLY